MDLLTTAEIAELLGLPEQKIISARGRFFPYVPMVRMGSDLRYPAEAITVFTVIAEQLDGGASADQVEQVLREQFPVSVLSAQPLKLPDEPNSAEIRDIMNAAHLDTLEQECRELRAELQALRQEMAKPALEDRIAGIQEQLVALTSLMLRGEAERQRTEHLRAQEPAAGVEHLTGLLAEVRQDLSHVVEQVNLLQQYRRASDHHPASIPPSPNGTKTETKTEQRDEETAPPRPSASRVPRRMGQSLFSNESQRD